MFDVANEAIRLTKDFIRFNTFEEEGKYKNLEYIMDYLGDDVADKQIVERDNAPYLIASIKGTGKKKFSLVLQGHIDVVPAGIWEEAFIPTEIDGKIRGRGACDMKSGCACALAAFKAAALDKDLKGDIYIAFTTDEEFSSQMVKEIINDFFPEAALAINAEPSEACIGIGQKGNLWLDVEIWGIAGHGSIPHVAKNTIEYGNTFLNHLFDFVKNEIPKKKDDLFGYPTYSVGAFQAGTHPNIIPDYCKIQVDRRYLPGETEAEIVKEIEDCIAKCDAELPGYKTKITKWDFGWHSHLFPMDTPLYADMCRALSRVENFEVKAKGVPYWGEAGFINDKIPCICFGPGSIDNAHSSHEFVLIDEVEKVAKGYWEIIKETCY